MVGMSTDLPNEQVDCAAYVVDLENGAGLWLCPTCGQVGDVDILTGAIVGAADHNRLKTD